MVENIQASQSDLASVAAAARGVTRAAPRGAAVPTGRPVGTAQTAETARAAVQGAPVARPASFVERSMDRMSSLFSFAMLAQIVMIPVAFVVGRVAQLFAGRGALDQAHHTLNSWSNAMNTTTIGNARDYVTNVKKAHLGIELPAVNTESVFTTVRRFFGEAKVAGGGKILSDGFRKSFLGNITRALPNTSIGHAMMAGMLATGSVALLLRTRRENVETNETLRHAAAAAYGVAPEAVSAEMLSGKGASEFVRNITAQAGKERNGRRIEGAGHMAGNAIFAATLGMGGGMSGMMGVMAGQMAVEQMASALNEKSTALEGYKVLALADAGQGMLSKPNREKAVKLVVGASPEIKAHGGVYNRLSGLIAKEMVGKGMTVQQVMQTANDPRAMASVVAELPKEKVAEALAPRPKHGQKLGKSAAHAAQVPHTPVGVHAAMVQKPAPMLGNTQIMAGGGAHAQRLQTAHIGHSSGLSS